MGAEVVLYDGLFDWEGLIGCIMIVYPWAFTTKIEMVNTNHMVINLGLNTCCFVDDGSHVLGF